MYAPASGAHILKLGNLNTQFMSQKYSYTTAEYLPWDTAMNLVRKLFKDGDYRMSLLVGCGVFFGLRVSDLLALTWKQIISDGCFVVIEQKTGKRREIKINQGFQLHIKDCFNVLKISDDEQKCFLNRYGDVISIQMVNRKLKSIKSKYRLQISNFSTHSLRKTWARKVWENENAAGRGEMALLKLSECLNHSSERITRRYIGLRQQELGELYDCLQF